MQLPNIEVVSAKVHEAWMQSKLAQGVTTRKAEDGEELMVPYEQLSEKAKQLDRGSVQAVYDAITALTPGATKFDVDGREKYLRDLSEGIGAPRYPFHPTED